MSHATPDRVACAYDMATVYSVRRPKLCGRPAKWEVRHPADTTGWKPVCGIHKRSEMKWTQTEVRPLESATRS